MGRGESKVNYRDRLCKKEKRACFADRSSAVNGKGCQELQIKASKCALTVNINLFREELSWRRAG